MTLTIPPPPVVLDRVTAEVGQAARRARNGVRHVTGAGAAPIGTAPKDAVWAADRAVLWRYRSTRVTRRTPVLIVNSLLGRSSLMDLTENASLVRSLVDAGLDVFMIDWGVTDERDAQNTLETYVSEYLRPAVLAASRVAAAPRVDVVGYCMGGVLSLLLAAHHRDLPLNSLTVLATPVDMTELTLFHRLLDADRLDADALLDRTGNVPPEVLSRAFSLLRPTAEVTKYATLWANLGNDEFMASYGSMARWLGQQIPVAGAAMRQCVEMLVRRNGLLTDDLRLHGEPVHLRDITCPLLNVVGEQDHVVPPASSAPLLGLVGSREKAELRLRAPHVGIVAGRTAVRVTVPALVDALRRRRDG